MSLSTSATGPFSTENRNFGHQITTFATNCICAIITTQLNVVVKEVGALQITSSYQVRTVRCSVSLDDTVRIYQEALSYLIGIVNDNWDAVRSITTGALEQQRYIEKLVHGNKNREFKYPDFDKKFHKYPSYLRRATITAAIGE